MIKQAKENSADNHNGSNDRANKTTEAAKQSRANAAVKLQAYIPDTITINCDKE